MESSPRGISSYKASRPWLGPLGELSWHISLSLCELAGLGRRSWWWKLHWGIWRRFRHIRPERLVRGQKLQSLSYGETPALTMTRVLELAGIPPGATVVDLGCGRGIPLLTAACLGYRARGLEFFEVYVEGCRRVAADLGVQVDLRTANMLEADWPDGDLYFLSSTAFPDDFRTRLVARLLELSPGKRVVTQDWILGEPFSLRNRAMLPVTWGTAYFSVYELGGVESDPISLGVEHDGSGAVGADGVLGLEDFPSA